MIGAMSNYLENKLIDFILRGQEFILPPELYAGLLSTPVGGDGSQIEEVSGGGYARVSMPRSLYSWCGTQGAGSMEPSFGSSGTTSNNAPIVFPFPTGGWGAVVAVAVFDAPEDGNILWHGDLAIPKVVYLGDDPPSFRPADLTIQLDL